MLSVVLVIMGPIRAEGSVSKSTTWTMRELRLDSTLYKTPQ